VFRALFDDETAAQRANAAFEDAYASLIAAGRAEPIAGAAEALPRLRAADIKVALTTGFSPDTQGKLIAALGWGDLADLVLAPGDG
ncbi:haloacid dehalogenase, partial [Mycobacterium sp. ITM-2017-0098]